MQRLVWINLNSTTSSLFLNITIPTSININGHQFLTLKQPMWVLILNVVTFHIFRMIYLNVVVNVIKKLRSEAAEAAKNKPASTSSSTSSTRDAMPNLITTHLQVLAGKPGTVGTWSIEKKTAPKLVTFMP